MTSPTQWPYLIELDRQCRLAVAAADRIRASVDGMWPADELLPVAGEFFDHVQRFVCSVGIIAKILYAQGSRHRDQLRVERSRWLRGLLGLDDISPIADARVRNTHEHIDERIDQWIEHHPGFTHYGHDGISRTGQAPPERLLRHYDLTSDTLFVWDGDLAVGPVLDAVGDLQDRLLTYRRQFEATNEEKPTTPAERRT
jgi:hypothetical protein